MERFYPYGVFVCVYSICPAALTGIAVNLTSVWQFHIQLSSKWTLIYNNNGRRTVYLWPLLTQPSFLIWSLERERMLQAMHWQADILCNWYIANYPWVNCVVWRRNGPNDGPFPVTVWVRVCMNVLLCLCICVSWHSNDGVFHYSL